MLRRSYHKTGQAVMGQYALVFFVVIAAVTAMTIYVRRGLQGRIRDARTHMIDTIKDGSGIKDISLAYEPYYQNRGSTRLSTQKEETGFRGGRIRQISEQVTVVNAETGQ